MPTDEQSTVRIFTSDVCHDSVNIFPGQDRATIKHEFGHPIGFCAGCDLEIDPVTGRIKLASVDSNRLCVRKPAPVATT